MEESHRIAESLVKLLRDWAPIFTDGQWAEMDESDRLNFLYESSSDIIFALNKHRMAIGKAKDALNDGPWAGDEDWWRDR